MYWSRTLIPTARETPADAQVLSHKLMIRAGLVRQLTAGVYDWLPLGWKAMQKVCQIIREEMDATGAVEVLLPIILPADPWKTTRRYFDYGPLMFRLKDRKDFEMVLGPTDEETITELVKAYVSSYKQLPLTLYQIQQKFRDEARPRNGLLRVREFIMKDAYSFHASLESLNETYKAQYDAYVRIFKRCGLAVVPVEAESGPIGGDASHEFILPCEAGEDVIVTSPNGNYAANVEKAETGDRPFNLAGEPKGELAKVHTPSLPSIEAVGEFMKVKPKCMLKSMVYCATKQSDDPDPAKAKEPIYLLAIVRGDHDINEMKLARVAKGILGEPVNLALAPDDLARADGWALGYVGPHAFNGRDDTYLVVDPDAAQPGFWAAGANEIDHHVKYFNWQREVGATPETNKRMLVVGIRNAAAGDPSPKNDGAVLQTSKGIELGHVFKLGTKYTDALDCKFADEKQQNHAMIMGCYGIGPGRVIVGALETLSDADGIVWPMSIAPYHVVITPIRYEGQAKEIADRLHAELTAKGIDVLVDDRDQRPGVKFKDADLIGIPLRIVLGDKGLANNQVELKQRTAKEPEMVPLDGLVDKIAAMVHAATKA